jgi:hypothetical protein
MKRFEEFVIDRGRCQAELADFKELLDGAAARTLKERDDILSFFGERRHLAALIGYTAPKITQVDRIAYEFDLFGDYAADLALGDSNKHQYCFVEFEDAAPDSIFKRQGKKNSLEWSSRFDRGYSQIIDWFWKLHDLARSDTGRSRFDHASTLDYYGLLVIGRSRGLAPLEWERLKWRRERVVVDSKHVYCMTFDELYEDLTIMLDKYVPAAVADPERMPSRRLRRRPRGKPRPAGRRRNPGSDREGGEMP